MGMDAEGELANPVNLPQAGSRHNRRRSDRFDLDMSLVARHAKNPGRVIQGRIIDLSCAGVRAVIAADLPVGDLVELQFGLPYSSAVVQLEAAVRSRQHYQYGLEFMRVNDSDRFKINQTCTALDLLR